MAKIEGNKPDVDKQETDKAEVNNSETATAEISKCEITKINVATLEVSKTNEMKSEIIIAESTKIGKSTNLEILEVDESAKTEMKNSEVKLEATESQEIKVSPVEDSEPVISEKNEPINSEVDDKIQEDENYVVEKDETSSDEKPEAMEVDQDENEKSNVSDADSKLDKDLSSIKTEQPKDIVDQSTNITVENTVSEMQEKNHENKSAVNEIEKTILCDDAMITESINKEIKDTTINISPETINKLDIKVSETLNKLDIKISETIIKSKECSASVESVDRLKAMFPELEVVHKDVATPSSDKLSAHKPLQQIDQTIAHLLATSYQNPIKWPKVK